MFLNRKIVTLCGSIRFAKEFEEASFRESVAGNIVLSVGCFHGCHGLCDNITQEQKKAFDALHFDKIAMSDEILVLNVGGYIGESTANEIAYAKKLGKIIRYLESFF